MSRQATPPGVQREICRLRAKHILGIETWTYADIRSELDVTDSTIVRYLSRAGLTSKKGQDRMLVKAREVLEKTDPKGQVYDAEEDLGNETGGERPGLNAQTGVGQPGPANDDGDWEIPLEDQGIEAFVPDAGDVGKPRGSAKKKDTTMTKDDDEDHDEAEHVLRYTCQGCNRPMAVRQDELGTVVECPYDDCDRKATAPTEQELIEAGVIQG